MHVSISKAADMVGITRATLYRHIEKKGISLTKDDDGNPRIDVSELIRIYGSRVKSEKITQNNDGVELYNDTDHKHYYTPKIKHDASVEIEVLRERVKHLEENKNRLENERLRERSQFEERIEQLQETLKKTQENQNKTTLLLEHYTKEGVGGDWQKTLKSLEDRIANHEDVLKDKLSRESEKASQAEAEKEALRLKLEENEKILIENKAALETEKSKSFLHKLLGK